MYIKLTCPKETYHNFDEKEIEKEIKRREKLYYEKLKSDERETILYPNPYWELFAPDNYC